MYIDLSVWKFVLDYDLERGEKLSTVGAQEGGFVNTFFGEVELDGDLTLKPGVEWRCHLHLWDNEVPSFWGVSFCRIHVLLDDLVITEYICALKREIDCFL